MLSTFIACTFSRHQSFGFLSVGLQLFYATCLHQECLRYKTIVLGGPTDKKQKKLASISKYMYMEDSPHPLFLESFEMWCWRRMEEIKWSEKVTNEQVLGHIGEKRALLNNIL